eukprot:scaffold9409_cov116-Isochrysis_galbana.AAC.6
MSTTLRAPPAHTHARSHAHPRAFTTRRAHEHTPHAHPGHRPQAGAGGTGTSGSSTSTSTSQSVTGERGDAHGGMVEIWMDGAAECVVCVFHHIPRHHPPRGGLAPAR